MKEESKRDTVAAIMRRINRVWLDGQVERLGPMVHPDIVMVLPRFTGRIQGREEFLAGFHDFCRNTTIYEFQDQDYQVDVAAETAVVTFRYCIIYERCGERYHSTGRDFWVFQKQGNAWVAVWRTMLDLEEKPA